MRQISFYRRTVSLLAKNRFFWFVVSVFVIETVWLALSGRYPMAFDEDFHLGVIKLYAHHISPFWSSQPKSADTFGAVFRDPSYLYQWLMSFLYRLINLFTQNQSAQVILLRFINIIFFTAGLILFRPILRRTGASEAIINVSFLSFILIPVVPLLAAQINYDNLFLPAIALVLLLVIKFHDELKAKRRFSLSLLFNILSLSLLACLVKYAFLPILLVVGLYLVICLARAFNSLADFKKGIKPQPKVVLLLASLFLVISVGLFSQRYIVNTLKYKNPLPDCSKVLSLKECNAYGPWIRDYNFKINKVDTDAKTSLGNYVTDWFYGMWLRLYFSVDGPGTNYQTRGPLPVPALTAIGLSLIGLVCLVIAIKKRLLSRYNHSTLVFLSLVAIVYIVALWLDELSSYLQTAQPVAINGRYLLPVLLPIILVLIMSINAVIKRQAVKQTILIIGLISLIYGGGSLTYVLRSNDAWYWHSQPIYDVNHALQQTIGPITPGHNDYAEFLK